MPGARIPGAHMSGARIPVPASRCPHPGARIPVPASRCPHPGAHVARLAPRSRPAVAVPGARGNRVAIAPGTIQ